MSRSIERLNPPRFHQTLSYHHISIIRAGRLAFLAGQCPLDPSGAVVGVGDIEAQVDRVVANATIALQAAGAGPEHVVACLGFPGQLAELDLTAARPD